MSEEESEEESEEVHEEEKSCVGEDNFLTLEKHTKETVLQLRVFKEHKTEKEATTVCIPVELILEDFNTRVSREGVKYFRARGVLAGGHVTVSEELGRNLRGAVELFYTGNGDLFANRPPLPLTFIAIDKGNHTENADPYYERMTLLDAAKNGFVKVVKALLGAQGIDVNALTSVDGATPLIMASQEGHVEVVKALLGAQGIDVNKQDTTYGATPLYVASFLGNVEVVKALLDAPDIEVNKAETEGATPLFMASQDDDVEVVKLLLDKGADVNKALTNGTLIGATPLLIASLRGNVEVVKALLDAPGIDVNKARTTTGTTPLIVASRKGHVEVVEALLDAQGIDVKKRDDDGKTALDLAISTGGAAVVKALQQALKKKEDKKRKHVGGGGRRSLPEVHRRRMINSHRGARAKKQ